MEIFTDLPTEQIPVPLYETISPLPTPPISPLHDSDPYSVFRNEISLSTVNSTTSSFSVKEFFSLDVNANNQNEKEEKPTVLHEPKTPTLPIEIKTQSSIQISKNALVSEFESSWFRGNGKFRSPMLQLHKEIVDFCDFLSPTKEEQEARDTAIKCVFDVIKYIWPRCKVEVFGSYKTGLYLPTSDVDVVILRSGITKPAIGLQALARALSQKGIAKKIQVIAKARVPIVKFVEKRSGVSFDLSFDVDNGPKAAEFIKDAVCKWPALRPLCLILKVFLQQRQLNEVYSGGIGSYALLTMLMALLKNLRECKASSEHNLGVLLIHFFDFYGRKLNNNDVGVSCEGACTFFLKRKRGFMNKGRPYLIAIQDPQAPDNDIGKNSFNYFQIKSAFSMAFSTLTNPMTIFSLGPNRSILGTIIRPDPVLLERKGGYHGEVTFSSLLPGAGEPLESLSHFDNQEILGNWPVDLDGEEDLPRGGGIAEDGGAESSRKKRKSFSKTKSTKSKRAENGDTGNIDDEEFGSRKDRKKRR